MYAIHNIFSRSGTIALFIKLTLCASGVLLPWLTFSQSQYAENQPTEVLGHFYTGYIQNGKYHGESTLYNSIKQSPFREGTRWTNSNNLCWKGKSREGGNTESKYILYNSITSWLSEPEREGTQFITTFEPTSKKSNRLDIGYGGDYSGISADTFTPDDLSKATNAVMKSMAETDYNLIWSSEEDWQFFFQFDGYSTQSNISGDYILVLVYEKSHFRPPNAILSTNQNGQYISIGTDSNTVEDILNNFQFNAMRFKLNGEQTKLRLSGRYGLKGDGQKVKALLFKKK